jgi:uncharacterized membrane protein YeiH
MSPAGVVLALDVLGTFAFALNGAFTASRKVRLDIVGILALGIITAIGGGMVRDVVIGAVPPAAFTEWYYLAVAAGGALIAFFVSRPPRLLYRSMLVLDAVGLSLFCVVGALKAVEFGLDPAPAIALGAVTAVGGGTIRDVLIGTVPSVLTSDLYAIPALVGASVAVAAAGTSVDVPGAVAGAALCFGIRLVGLRFRLNAPVARHDAPG